MTKSRIPKDILTFKPYFVQIFNSQPFFIIFVSQKGPTANILSKKNYTPFSAGESFSDSKGVLFIVKSGPWEKD